MLSYFIFKYFCMSALGLLTYDNNWQVYVLYIIPVDVLIIHCFSCHRFVLLLYQPLLTEILN